MLHVKLVQIIPYYHFVYLFQIAC